VHVTRGGAPSLFPPTTRLGWAANDQTEERESPMTGTTAADTVLQEFTGAWRDDTPVFGCCRRTVTVAVDRADVYEIGSLGATERVQGLRAAVEAELPGHLATHRCCAGHVADLAFDLPDLLAPADSQ
jgi:hypothetical protein